MDSKDKVGTSKIDLLLVNEDLRQINETLRQANEAIRSNNEVLHTDNDGIRRDNDALHGDNEDLRKDNDDLRKDNSDIRQNHAALQQRIATLEEEVSEMKLKLALSWPHTASMYKSILINVALSHLYWAQLFQTWLSSDEVTRWDEELTRELAQNRSLDQAVNNLQFKFRRERLAEMSKNRPSTGGKKSSTMSTSSQTDSRKLKSMNPLFYSLDATRLPAGKTVPEAAIKYVKDNFVDLGGQCNHAVQRATARQIRQAFDRLDVSEEFHHLKYLFFLVFGFPLEETYQRSQYKQERLVVATSWTTKVAKTMMGSIHAKSTERPTTAQSMEATMSSEETKKQTDRSAVQKFHQMLSYVGARFTALRNRKSKKDEAD